MSMILEALRKSEHERRRNEAPGLFAPAPAATAAPRAHGPSRYLPAAIALLGAGALLVLLLREPPGASRSPAAVVQPPARTAVDAAAVAKPLRAPPAQAAALPVPATDTAHVITPSPAPNAAEAPAIVRIAAPSAAPAARDVARAGVAPPASVASDDRYAPPPARGLNQAPAPAAEAAAATAPGTSAPTGAPAIGNPATPLALSDLGLEARAGLPPLRLSMHLWDASPARRFVIIDGQRLAEGDRLGTLVVERILADGVLLAGNGYRLRLPLR